MRRPRPLRAIKQAVKRLARACAALVKPALGRAGLAAVAYLLIGAGVYAVYPPAAFVIVGGLLWFDLFTLDGRRRKDTGP